MPHARFSNDEIIRRGEEIYTKSIRNEVEPEQNGKFLVVDIETEEYEVADEALAAIDRAKEKHQDAALYIVRVGSPAAINLGSGFRMVKP